MRSPVGPWPLTMPTPSPASIRHVLGQNPRNWVNHFRSMDIRAPRCLNNRGDIIVESHPELRGDAMKRSMLVLAIAAFAAIASPSTTSARLSDLMETRQAQPNYAQYYYGPYRRHVRRVYRRAYRRAYYGYPYSYGGYYGGYQPYSYGGGYYPYSYGGYRPYYFGPYRRHVRRVYRRAYRRGYY